MVYELRMTQTFTAQVAANVRAELARRGLSQVDIATTLGVSQAAVSRRLSGSVPLDVNEVAAIADLLGITPSQLVSAAA